MPSSSMSVTDSPEGSRRIPKAPEDRPLPAQNCCTLCLYNIPSGSLMILLPGLVMLLTGIAVMSWTKLDKSWNGDLTTASLIFLIIGGILTMGGLIYWCTMWVKYRPKVTVKRKTVSPRENTGGVELVAVQRRDAQEPDDIGEMYVIAGPSGGGRGGYGIPTYDGGYIGPAGEGFGVLSAEGFGVPSSQGEFYGGPHPEERYVGP